MYDSVNDINLNKDKPIRLVWLGVVRYFDHQVKIIDKLRNDQKFHIIYHGSGPDLDKLKVYCKSNKINNVEFTGAYDNRIKAKLLSEADILNNSYNLESSE